MFFSQEDLRAARGIGMMESFSLDTHHLHFQHSDISSGLT